MLPLLCLLCGSAKVTCTVTRQVSAGLHAYTRHQCLCRHNTYLQECTAVRDATYAYTIHDLKHLLIKFALEKSFSEDSGGGGRESNMCLIPYIMHMALYVINTSVSQR